MNVCWCYFIDCVSWSYFIGWSWCVFLIIWILYFWSFVCLVSFCPYCFILFLKSDSNPKHFSFCVFNFNVENKISSTPTWLLHLQEFSIPPAYSNLSIIRFWRIFLTLFIPPPPHFPYPCSVRQLGTHE